MRIDGAVRDLSDPLGRSGSDRDRDARRSARAGTDPPRCRARAGRGRAGAVAGHAGDDRPGDRERLLLRFRQATSRSRPTTCRSSRRRCARSSARNKPFTKEVWSRDKAQAGLCRQGRGLQGRADRRDSRGPGPQDLHAGRLVRPLPRPAHGLDRPDRQRLQADEGGRRLLARRQQQPDADAHLRHGLGRRRTQLDAYLHMLEEAEKRDHRKLGREMDLFHFQEEGPGVVFWHAKGWKMFQSLVAYMRRRLDERAIRRSTRRRCSTSRCGRRPATGAGTATTCSR